MKRLSIIIPIYNVEQYIERCLRSICEQDIHSKEYEVICINDGSPDNSLELLYSLQKEYSNIHIISQENQGVSRARNNGMDIALGNYLLFIDPDDYVESGTFKRILEEAERKSAQISFLGFTVLDKTGRSVKEIYNEKFAGPIYSGITAYSLDSVNKHTDPDRIWAVLLKRDFINQYGLRFLPDVPYLEDGELITRILCLADKCIFDGRSFYLRTTRPGSATNSDLFHTPRATVGFFTAAKNLKHFQKESYLDEAQKCFLNQPICKYVALTVDSVRKQLKIKRVKEVSKMLHDAGLGRLDLKGLNREFFLLGWTYNRGIWLLMAYQLHIRIIRSFGYRIRRWIT